MNWVFNGQKWCEDKLNIVKANNMQYNMNIWCKDMYYIYVIVPSKKYTNNTCHGNGKTKRIVDIVA